MGMCWKNESKKTAHIIIPLTSKIKLEFGLVLKGNSRAKKLLYSHNLFTRRPIGVARRSYMLITLVNQFRGHTHQAFSL